MSQDTNLPNNKYFRGNKDQSVAVILARSCHPTHDNKLMYDKSTMYNNYMNVSIELSSLLGLDFSIHVFKTLLHFAKLGI